MVVTLPIWIRLPQQMKDSEGNIIQPARCAYTGLSAAKIWELSVPNQRNKFNPPVLSISVEEDQANESAGQEAPTPTKKRKGSFVRLIRLSGTPPGSTRKSLLDYLDSLAVQQAGGQLTEAQAA